MKISQKLIILFLLSSLTPVIGVGLFAYSISRNTLEGQIQSEITNVANRQADKIDSLVNNYYEELTIFNNRQQVRVATKAYNASHSSADQEALNNHLAEARLDNRSMRRIHILDTNGKVIGSSDPKFVGQSFQGSEVFKVGHKADNASIVFKDVNGELGLYLAGPLFLRGEQIGTTILEYQVEGLRSILNDYSDLGTTGETFLARPANGHRHYLLPLRFNSDAALGQFNSSSGQDRDYRNQQVLRKSRTINRTDWVMYVQITASEVYAPVYRISKLTIIALAATSVVVCILGWLISTWLVAPLGRFTKIVRRIENGDLSLRVPFTSRDEIATLGQAFNTMTDSLLESRARLTASIMSVPFGFALVDKQNRIVLANPLLNKLLNNGTSQKAPVSGDLFATVSNNLKDVINISDYIQQSQTKKRPIEQNIEYGPMFFRLIFAPIISENDRILGSVIIIEDTTERMALQRSRDEFFSIASHELRTPLTAIRGNTGMMLDYFDAIKNDPELHQMVLDNHQASTRLIDIVNDFLDMSRLEQDRMTMEPSAFELPELIQQTLREYDVTSSRRKLRLELLPNQEPVPPVFADRNRTREVLINLLANAIRFTTSGGVTFGLKQSGQHVEITITDTGCGIPLESQHLLFRKFQQASNNILTRDNTHGTGLGLYISRLMCQKMGGDVRLVSSEVGKGSTFAVTLPTAKAKPAPKHKTGDPIS